MYLISITLLFIEFHFIYVILNRISQHFYGAFSINDTWRSFKDERI